jgi:hypothetical protein
VGICFGVILYEHWIVCRGFTVRNLGICCGKFCTYSGQVLRDRRYVQLPVIEGYAVRTVVSC